MPQNEKRIGRDRMKGRMERKGGFFCWEQGIRLWKGNRSTRGRGRKGADEVTIARTGTRVHVLLFFFNLLLTVHRSFPSLSPPYISTSASASASASATATATDSLLSTSLRLNPFSRLIQCRILATFLDSHPSNVTFVSAHCCLLEELIFPPSSWTLDSFFTSSTPLISSLASKRRDIDSGRTLDMIFQKDNGRVINRQHMCSIVQTSIRK